MSGYTCTVHFVEFYYVNQQMHKESVNIYLLLQHYYMFQYFSIINREYLVTLQANSNAMHYM